jgi:hypothetical protein
MELMLRTGTVSALTVPMCQPTLLNREVRMNLALNESVILATFLGETNPPDSVRDSATTGS